MGFLDAMKGANNSWGTATGSWGIGYFGPKNLVNNTAHEFMISSTIVKNSIVFKKDDVESMKLIAATSDWVKFRLTLKNKFEAIVTIYVTTVDKKGNRKMNMDMANLEWWLGGVIY